MPVTQVLVSVLSSPLAPGAPASTKAWRTVVSALDSSGTSLSGNSNYAANAFNVPYERPGASTYYRVRMAFPSGTNAAFPGKFTPQTWKWPDGNGGWNMLLAWHEPSGRVAGKRGFPMSSYLGIRYGRLFVRWVGGPRSGGTHLVWSDDRPLLYDHWYDIVLHVVWDHTGSSGYVEGWVDGRQILPGVGWPARFATLWRYDAAEGGGYGPVWNQIGHYRRSPISPYVDTHYIDSYRVGPTRASVGG